MSNDDDDTLGMYDLSAWDAPAPQAGLADAVIAQVKAEAGVPAAVGALETGAPPIRRRWWIAGGIAAALAASVALVTLGLTRAPQNGSGDVVATQARVVEIGPSRATLDPGAEIHWRRDKHHVTVTQARGAVTWNVGGDDSFVIDAGATVASVEATGASLRVEVKMNASDARTIGAVAVTAAVVALVTVVVYEGRVKVVHDGQSVNVPAGSTLDIHATPDPIPVAQQEEIEKLRAEIAAKQAELVRSAGAPSPELERMREELAEKDRQILALQQQLENTNPPKTVPAPAKTAPGPACDEVSCVLNNYEGACCAKFKVPAKPAPCDTAALNDKGDKSFANGMNAAALVAYESSYACKADAFVLRKAAMAACNAKKIDKVNELFAKLDPNGRAAITQICVRNGITPATAASCDPAALKQKGEDYLNMGMDQAALGAFEASIACKPDPGMNRFAFMAACRAKNEPAARKYYARLPPNTTASILQICLRNGISLDEPVTEPTRGTLNLQSKPTAEVFFDGKDMGATTPMSLQVTPGKHKITYAIDGNKYTWAVTIEAGKTVTMVKDLSGKDE